MFPRLFLYFENLVNGDWGGMVVRGKEDGRNGEWMGEMEEWRMGGWEEVRK